MQRSSERLDSGSRDNGTVSDGALAFHSGAFLELGLPGGVSLCVPLLRCVGGGVLVIP